MSGPSGGRPNFRFSPVREDGTRREYDNISSDVDIIGVHAGDYAGLNIVNPQPGFHYQWAKADPTSRMIEAQKGGQPVQAGDTDHPAYKLGIVYDESDTPTPLDTAEVYQDVVLMRYPEEVIVERRRQDADKSLRAVSEADNTYLNGASPAELASGQGQRTRFAQRRHNLQVQDESGAVQKQWTPDLGILDTD